MYLCEIIKSLSDAPDYTTSDISLPQKKEKEEKPTEIVYLSQDINETTSFLNRYQFFGNSHLAHFFYTLFDPMLVQKKAQEWGLREELLTDFSLALFPYINRAGQLAMFKRIPYGADGHRLKETPYSGNVESAKKTDNQDFEKCFFGEHRIASDTKNIIVVESEKTAFILDLFFSNFNINKECVVVACGGKSWLNNRLNRPLLNGKNIFLIADLSKEENNAYDWEITPALIETRERIGINNISLIDFSALATEEEKMHGADIADIILRFLQSNSDISPLIECLTIKESAGEEEFDIDELPHLNFERLYSLSPQILKDIADLEIVPELKECLLLASILAFGQTFDNITFDYGAEINQHLQLNLIVNAKSGSGKGKLNTVRLLFNKVHDRINAGSRVAREAWEIKRQQRDETTPPPPNKTLFIPGNTTSAALHNTLYENDGRGLIIETETATFSTSQKGKHGDFFASWRNAFHGESISINRRQDNTLIEIPSPHFSVLLAGTEDQNIDLLKGHVQDGTFSRICFYTIKTKREWRNPFKTNTTSLIISLYQERIERIYNNITLAGKIQTEISDKQKDEMNDFMQSLFEDYKNFTDEESDSSIFRMGIVFFRVAIIISALEYEDKPMPPTLTISDNAFEFAKTYVESMLPHTFKMWDILTKCEAEGSGKEERVKGIEILNQLPDFFTRNDLNKLVPARTATYNLKQWLNANIIRKVRHGEYIKLR